MKRIDRVRLYPTHRHVARLQFALDVTRQLYNALLEERREAYRRRRVNVGTREQYAAIAALHRLDLAFMAFFRRIKSGEKAGYPRFKPAVSWNQLEFPDGDRALRLDADERRAYVPGIGSVRLRKGRPVLPSYGRAWIVRRNDRWYACFEYERPVTPLPSGERHVRARRKAPARLRRSKEREANARLDRLHKIARAIVNRADVIALEKLDMRAMTRGATVGAQEDAGCRCGAGFDAGCGVRHS